MKLQTISLSHCLSNTPDVYSFITIENDLKEEESQIILSYIASVIDIHHPNIKYVLDYSPLRHCILLEDVTEDIMSSILKRLKMQTVNKYTLLPEG